MMRPRMWMSAFTACALLSVTGCQDSGENQAASAAQKALGVDDSKAKTKPTRVDYEVVERVIDPKSGKVLSEKKTVTPVEVQVEIKKDVEADVGETRAEAG